MNIKIVHILLLTSLFIGSLPFSLRAQPCECTNCPAPITDNGTFQGFLDVTVNGPNNLALCPLQRVCFEIQHTWVGDLCVTLTSPSGLNYMVMADVNNNFGGCGTNADNINVCIDVGTGNPLTNNTEYVCNGPPNLCLVGKWTVPCGGVTDPVTGAQQAPGCDLNAFNVPGGPVNGTWMLTVNDICSQDAGFLINWSLAFACGVKAGFSFEILAGNQAVFTNTSSNGTSFFWEFGDDKTSTEASPVHTYDEPGTYLVTLTATNECGTSSTTREIILSSAFDRSFLDKLLIYPNPSDGHFTVWIVASRASGETAQLRLINALGQELMRQEAGLIQGEWKFSVEQRGFAVGLYWLEIQIGTQKTGTKLVIE